MVNRDIIEKTFDKILVGLDVKCHITIKERFESFNSKDYKSEKYSRKLGQIKTSEKSPVGALQQRQEDLQDEIDYTNEEKSMLSLYSISTYEDYASWFYKVGIFVGNKGWEYNVYKWHWEEQWDEERGMYLTNHVLDDPLTFQDYDVYDFTNWDAQDDSHVHTHDDALYTVPFPQTLDILDNMIDKSPPLQENTVLYRLGSFDGDLIPGQTAKWKSYTSTSFNSYTAKNGLKKYAGFEPGEDRYEIKIYAPQGTKGVVPCQNTGCQDWQSEFTLGRNQKYIVLSVDKVNKKAEVLLY